MHSKGITLSINIPHCTGKARLGQEKSRTKSCGLDEKRRGIASLHSLSFAELCSLAMASTSSTSIVLATEAFG